MKYMSPRRESIVWQGLAGSWSPTGCVDIVIALEDTHIVPFADALDRSGETSQSSTDDEDVNPGLRI
jgi:hypothetical protein